MRLAALGVVLEFLDGLTTFIIITLGLGYEANPRISFINDNPILVFPIFLAQAAFVGGVGYLAWLEKKHGYMRPYYVTAMPLIGYLFHKGLVVANNVVVGVFGYEGMDYYVSETFKAFMVLGGLTYGLIKTFFLKTQVSL
jgi:hypothetical protein